jgi:hypothetical protein
MTEAECRTLISRTSPEMCRHVAFCGSVKEVASQLQGFVDAGLDVCIPVDWALVLSSLEEAQGLMSNQLDVCRVLKAQGKPATVSV